MLGKGLERALVKTEVPFLSRVVLSAQGAPRTDDDNDDDTVATLGAQTVKNLPAVQETQV